MKAALLVLLLVGCAAPRPAAHDPIRLAARAPGIEQRDVDAAGDWWNERLGCKVFTGPAAGYDHVVVLESRKKRDEHAGATWDRGMRIEVYDASDVTRVHTALVHELGHVLGLEHSTDERSVMHRRPPMPSLLGDEDEFARFPWVESLSVDALRARHCKSLNPMTGRLGAVQGASP